MRADEKPAEFMVRAILVVRLLFEEAWRRTLVSSEGKGQGVEGPLLLTNGDHEGP